jgi:bacterioferritin-associated ferredoxin
VYLCHCFAVTEAQVLRHAEDGARTPRQIASACKAGTDCGSCVRRIQALLGRGACPRPELADQGGPALAGLARPALGEPDLGEPALEDAA